MTNQTLVQGRGADNVPIPWQQEATSSPPHAQKGLKRQILSKLEG